MERKELFARLGELKREISSIKKDLNAINKEKEDAFSSKREMGKQIRELIGAIKASREKRNILTKEIKELKSKRDVSNKLLRDKIAELNRLKEEKIKAMKSLKIKQEPSKLKIEIERLEQRIETEGMPFSREQELMKKIKGLKKLYEEGRVIVEMNSRTKELMKELNNTRKDGNDSHKLVQEKAEQNQEEHEKMIKLSKSIDELTAREEGHYKTFLELKKKFNEANNNLKQKLEELRAIDGQIASIKNEQIARKIEQETRILKSKEEIVEEKIRRGQKLTTEDILVLQGMGGEDF